MAGGSWQGDIQLRERVVGCYAGFSRRRKLIDRVTSEKTVYSASSGFFPLGGDALAVTALTPARTWGRCSGEGSAAAPGGYRLVMAKHHPDLIFCRKQAGVGETQGVGE